MRFAVNFPPFAEAEELVELAVDAERAGWDAVFVWDHVLHDPSQPPVVDPWVVLGAMAARTERVLLGPCVTPLARRRPQVVACQSVTLDRLSHGCLVLGVGLGHPPHEDFAAFGDDGDARVSAARLDEALAVVSGLWSAERFSHSGEHFRVDDVQFVPPPLQQPRPRVWVACVLPGRRPLARAARWDGVVPMQSDRFLDPDDIASIAADIARDRGSLHGFDIVVNAGPPPHATVDEFAAAGATWWMASMGHFPGWLDELRGVVRAGPPRA